MKQISAEIVVSVYLAYGVLICHLIEVSSRILEFPFIFSFKIPFGLNCSELLIVAMIQNYAPEVALIIHNRLIPKFFIHSNLYFILGNLSIVFVISENILLMSIINRYLILRVINYMCKSILKFISKIDLKFKLIFFFLIISLPLLIFYIYNEKSTYFVHFFKKVLNL